MHATTWTNPTCLSVLGCLILGFAAMSYFLRRKQATAATPAPKAFKVEGALAPCAPAQRQRTPSKLFEDLIRAAYAAHEGKPGVNTVLCLMLTARRNSVVCPASRCRPGDEAEERGRRHHIQRGAVGRRQDSEAQERRGAQLLVPWAAG